jgi:hypothetical protein
VVVGCSLGRGLGAVWHRTRAPAPRCGKQASRDPWTIRSKFVRGGPEGGAGMFHAARKYEVNRRELLVIDATPPGVGPVPLAILTAALDLLVLASVPLGAASAAPSVGMSAAASRRSCRRAAAWELGYLDRLRPVAHANARVSQPFGVVGELRSRQAVLKHRRS